MVSTEIKVIFRWKNYNQSYSSTKEVFKSEEELNTFWNNACKDHSIRKPLGYHRE